MKLRQTFNQGFWVVGLSVTSFLWLSSWVEGSDITGFSALVAELGSVVALSVESVFAVV